MALDPITAGLEIGKDIIARLWPDPAQRDAGKLALQQLQQDGQIRFAELDVKDLDSARQREVGTKDKVNRNLAYLIVGAFVGVIIATLAGYSKTDSVLAGTLIGYLSAKAEQVISYYFGSTHSSGQKNDIISNMMKK